MFQSTLQIHQALYSSLPGVPKNFFDCLIGSKFKTTVFTRPVLIFSKSSYFNLNFGIKRSKIGSKFAEQWLPKAKISEPVDHRRLNFSDKCINLRQPYWLTKFTEA